MSRIAARFSALREQGRKALIPFVTAGDPHKAVTVPLMHSMVAAGADLIELGVPFSDPMADGPVIQRSSERALEHNTTMHDVLAMVREFRQQDADTPVVLMGYLNPIEALGAAEFASDAKAAGVDGVLTVDLPPEEGGDYVQQFDAAGLDPIFLLSPTTTSARMDVLSEAARGFVYYVSVKGVTGAASLDTDAVAAKVAEIRTHTELPIGVGFGIRDGATAAAVAQVADAIIVGSAIVSRMENLAERPDEIAAQVSSLLSEMRQAIDAS